MTMTTTASLGEDPQVDSDASSDFAAEYREALRKLGRFNLAVFGKTGAGKSTLVNAIFGEEVAATGVGKPVTQATTYHEHPSGIFGMFDCVGFETGESGDAILAALSSEVLPEFRRMWSHEWPIAVAG